METHSRPIERCNLWCDICHSTNYDDIHTSMFNIIFYKHVNSSMRTYGWSNVSATVLWIYTMTRKNRWIASHLKPSRKWFSTHGQSRYNHADRPITSNQRSFLRFYEYRFHNPQMSSWRCWLSIRAMHSIILRNNDIPSPWMLINAQRDGCTGQKRKARRGSIKKPPSMTKCCLGPELKMTDTSRTSSLGKYTHS